MEFNFSLRRLLLFAACIGLFAALGGFTPPAPQEGRNPHSQRKAWTYCIILFVVGAASVSVVDHVIGTMDPTNLRPAYIVLGALLMVAGALWLRATKTPSPSGEARQAVMSSMSLA